MKAINALLFLMSIGFCVVVHAQNESGTSLRGITSVGIVVEYLDDDGQKCGIARDALDAAVRLPLSNSRMRVVKDGSQFLYVRVEVIPIYNDYSRCAANVKLSFHKYVHSEREFGAFWNRSGLLFGSSAFVSKSVNEALEGYTKQFIAAWLIAN